MNFNFPSNQKVINYLHKYYGIQVINLIPISLGADPDAAVYRAKVDNNLSYFVKLNRGFQHGIAPIIMKFLQDAEIPQIIPIFDTLQGESSQVLDNYTLTVFSFVEGENGFTRELTNMQWYTFGKVLKKIHAIDLPLFIQNSIKQETYSSQWRETLKLVYDYIQSEPKGDELALKMLIFLKNNREAILRLVDRAEQLAEKIKTQNSDFVLCHSDLHAGNILMNKNEEFYIVDWDTPIKAPKERDLMFIGGGVANVWNKKYEEENFYAGYGKTKIDRNILAYYRYERIIEDIAIYGQQLLLTSEGGKKRSEFFKQFIDLFAVNGVVEIAFKTDDQPIPILSFVD
ncbi:MAG: spectinomycin phosphotransferase [Francisellaceae bacterium]|nr:spectinomycin phosphotransferase [Francisellaceae bacterium]